MPINYQKLRNLREQKTSGAELEKALEKLLQDHLAEFPNDWLLWLEAYELTLTLLPKTEIHQTIQEKLNSLKNQDEKSASLINDGLALASQNL